MWQVWGPWVGLGPQVDLAVLVADPSMVDGVEMALAVLDDLVRVRVRVRGRVMGLGLGLGLGLGSGMGVGDGVGVGLGLGVGVGVRVRCPR